MKSMVEMIRAW